MEDRNLKLWRADPDELTDDEALHVDRFFRDPPASPATPPPAPPAAPPVMPRTFHEVLRAVQLRVIDPEEARYYLGQPARRRRWWPR